jgi:dTMP kinase
VLSYGAFRRLWIALSLSSLGDWLGLLATTALASELAGGGPAGRKASFAIGGVLIFRLMPAVVLGPFAGAFADRFDRRKTMVVCDLLRFAVFASIPAVRSLPYLLLASFVVEAISLFWIPAKEASVPNLLPPAKLEAANQISLITTYGTAPLAAGVFAGLAKLADALGAGIGFFRANPVDLALYFDAATFLFSALTVYRLKEIRGARKAAEAEEDDDYESHGVFRDIAEGWRFVASSPLIRGLVVGILGAFAAGGAAIALGRPFVGVLRGGDAAYGMLFGAIFTGLALGMALGPRLLANLSRRRLFGLAIIGAGVSLSVMSLLPHLILALFATLGVGAWAGIAWIVGYTLLGLEVEDDKRGRTFATVQSLVRVDLLLVLALAPVLAGVIGPQRIGLFRVYIRADGVTLTLFFAGLLAVCVGVLSYRQMDDSDVPLWRELARSLPWLHRTHHGGLFIAFEGGEGVGKSTQAALLAEWLRTRRDDVVVTFEPGATKAGAAIRKVLLSRSSADLSPRAEAMLYAADRADHVANVVRPALARGAVVVTDRYVDSSLAYQGAGRALRPTEIRRLSDWATEGLRPDLTVLLDLDPAVGLARAGGTPDRMEAESLVFHERVRTAFRELAHHGRSRYVVIDASQSPEEVAEAVRTAVERRLRDVLDAPVPAAAREAVTT